MSEGNVIRITSGSFVAVCNECGTEVEVELNFGQQVEVEDLADELADVLYYSHEWEDHCCKACRGNRARDEFADNARREAAVH